MKAARALDPDLEVVVMTAFGTVETAVEAMKEGAWDFVTKPLRRSDIVRAVRKALEKRSLIQENRQLKAALARGAAEEIVGRSPAMRRVLEEARQVAPSVASVLITGESGTGKGVLARWIHKASGRAAGPLVVV
ncbi:MAG: sigma-54-dependent transcriptional regulator, partial [bacterium]